MQYASATGSTWLVTNLSGTIPAGRYYLIHQPLGSGCNGSPCGSPLPGPDASGSTMMSSSSGKVALVTSQVALTCGAFAGDCLPNPSVRDFVGYGTANNAETSPAPMLRNTSAALRAVGGCTDTDQNGADFTAVTRVPRNSSSPPNLCAGEIRP